MYMDMKYGIATITLTMDSGRLNMESRVGY